MTDQNQTDQPLTTDDLLLYPAFLITIGGLPVGLFADKNNVFWISMWNLYTIFDEIRPTPLEHDLVVNEGHGLGDDVGFTVENFVNEYAVLTLAAICLEDPTTFSQEYLKKITNVRNTYCPTLQYPMGNKSHFIDNFSEASMIDASKIEDLYKHRRQVKKIKDMEYMEAQKCSQ